MFNDLAKDEEKWARFQSNFGRYIKVGVIEDRDNKDALLKLATFASSASDDKAVRGARAHALARGGRQADAHTPPP